MRAIMVMYDSLSKRMLESYNKDTSAITPNFKRLQEKTAMFENFYVGSLPCMPARRELHTGRYNFLHRSWGPLEPFDNSMPEILKKNDIYTHIVSDHLHYWGDGGATYHTRYSSWECVRGQVADSFIPKVAQPEIPPHVPTMREFTHPDWWTNYWKNKANSIENDYYPSNQTFHSGLKFLEDNKNEDNWFLQIETFDPHEPFDVPDTFLDMYEDEYEGDFFNSPPYGVVSESDQEVKHLMRQYAALITMCDKHLGSVLDFMDENNMWDDTMLIVNTDHGLFVGEKDWWAKSVMPCYNEVSNTPFFMWDPRVKKTGTRNALAQTIDIAPTILDFFGLDIPKEVEGKVLKPVIENDEKVRDFALFGYLGSFVNITDGKNTYMRAAQNLGNTPLYEYTLMTMNRSGFLSPQEIKSAKLIEPLSFTKDMPVLKFESGSKMGAPIFCNSFQFNNLLWNVEEDAEQTRPVVDYDLEAKMINLLMENMQKSDAPLEQYTRLGLDINKKYIGKDVKKANEDRSKARETILDGAEFDLQGETLFVALAGLMSFEELQAVKLILKEKYQGIISFDNVVEFIKAKYVKNPAAANYFISKLVRLK